MRGRQGLQGLPGRLAGRLAYTGVWRDNRCRSEAAVDATAGALLLTARCGPRRSYAVVYVEPGAVDAVARALASGSGPLASYDPRRNVIRSWRGPVDAALLVLSATGRGRPPWPGGRAELLVYAEARSGAGWAHAGLYYLPRGGWVCTGPWQGLFPNRTGVAEQHASRCGPLVQATG